MPLRLYAQSCGACDRRWVLVTAYEADTECPYCGAPDPSAVADPHWPPVPPGTTSQSEA